MVELRRAGVVSQDTINNTQVRVNSQGPQAGEILVSFTKMMLQINRSLSRNKSQFYPGGLFLLLVTWTAKLCTIVFNNSVGSLYFQANANSLVPWLNVIM
jgi:hypothetical protein